MNKLSITIGFFLMLIGQWLVPGRMIFNQEKVLSQGNVYRFKTRPIDPYDPFRGKYVSLQYELNKVVAPKLGVTRGDEIYIYIEADSLGFAQAVQASRNKLAVSNDYLKVSVTQTYRGNVHFNLPFNRFYMEESKAYNAEVAVRNSSRRRDTQADICYAVVYVKGDVAVLDNVYVGHVSLQKFVVNEK